MSRQTPRSTLFPYTTLFRSEQANAQLADAQQRLMALSREAGMAEVATGILHNVGNVLNSVNVSATIVANKVRDSRVSRLSERSEEHTSELQSRQYLVCRLLL